jgi:hypothetical protein
MASEDKEILNQYYQALKNIDDRYRELEFARTELVWYEEKLREADQLAIQYGIDKPSNYSVNNVVLPDKLERNSLDSTLEEVSISLNKHRSLQAELIYTTKQLQKQFEETLESLSEQLKNVNNNLRTINESINELKTARIIHLFILIGVGFSIGYYTKNLQTTLICLGITIFILFCIVPSE